MKDSIVSGDFSLKVLLFFIFLLIVVASFFLGRVIQKVKDFRNVKKQREDAIKRSRAVLGGQFSEQLSPYFPNFPCNPGDARFIGKPIDFIAFPGSAEGKSIEEVLLIEVKSGQSKLSEREKQIKSAVESGKVRYIEYRVPE